MGNRDYFTDPQYAEWRRKVRKRDGNCCQWPECKESRYQHLHVHHIRSWANNVLLRYDPNNGITLCKLHHKLTYRNEDLFLKLFLDIVRRNNERTDRT